jgi:uncharacterized protein
MNNLHVTDSKFAEVVKRLTDHFKPQKIYLFGSQANGTADEDSDYDLFLIVENSDLPPGKRMVEAQNIAWDLGVSADVFIYTEKEFDEWKNEINTIANTVYTEGREISFGP